MTTTKLIFGAVTVLTLAMAGFIHWQQRRTQSLVGEVAALREQAGQVVLLREETQRLVEQLKAAANRSEADNRELMRLRAQAGTLRQTEQENIRLKAEHDRLAQQNSQRSQVRPEDNPYDPVHGPGAGIKVSHAKHWGYALILYAANHQNQFPTSLEQAAPFLHDELSAEAKTQAILAATQYEILYRGLRDDLASFPPESTIIIRERQAWLDQNGKWCKAYCMSDGGAYIRSSRKDDFEKWESIRIPRPKGQ